MWFLAIASIVGALVLFGLSVFPGMLEQIPDRPAFVACVILAGGAGLLALVRLLTPSRPDRPRRHRSAVVVLVVLVIASTFLTARVPRRVAFALNQSEFEKLLVKSPPPGDRSFVALNAEIVPYFIDQWGADRRGGVYLRTLVGVGPNGASFGFVHRPNEQGSPFGDVNYRLQHLGGDWYSFAASER